MPTIEIVPRPVYRSPSMRRCFLSAASAADAEARALLSKKYPPERAAYEDSGRMYDPGYHWREDARLVLVHARLKRRILRKFREQAKA